MYLLGRGAHCRRDFLRQDVMGIQAALGEKKLDVFVVSRMPDDVYVHPFPPHSPPSPRGGPMRAMPRTEHKPHRNPHDKPRNTAI